ncbi:MAG: S-layer homology domain-containing protein [Chloroflexi bacterium]|nr:S-layer homology domain-containing protein [Chloroflexota bacterium]
MISLNSTKIILKVQILAEEDIIKSKCRKELESLYPPILIKYSEETMNKKYLTNKSPIGVRFMALILAIMLLLLGLPSASVSAAPRAIPAVDGDGAMTVSPTSAVYGSTGNTFTFTFTPTGGRDFETGSSVRLTIPAGWPAPVMLTNVFVNTGTCSLNPSWTINGSTIIVDVWSCLSGQSFTITYSGVTAPGFSGSPYTFLTETDVPGGNGIFPIAASPTVTITPAPLTVSAAGLTPANKVYDGNTTATLTIGTPTLVGVIGSDTVSLVTSGATGTFIDEVFGTAKTVNISGLTLGGADAGNYTLTQPTRTANITARPITITANAGQTKVFGTADPVYTYSANEPLIGGNSFSGALNRAAGENVGSYAIGLGTLSAGANYAITFVSDNFTITAKPITVTANAGQTKVFGSADPTFAYTSSDLGASFTGALDRVAGENVGTYAIGQGTLAVVGSNYTMSFASDNFTITAKPITVTANAGQTKVFGAVDPLTFTYTSSDLGASFTGALDRAAGENVGAYAIGQGTLAVVGSNYTMSFVSNNFTITAKPIAVTANAGQTKVFGAADPTFTYISSDLAAPFIGALDRAAGENVGAYAIGQGTLSAGANYSIIFTSNNFTITAKPITVTADAGQTKVYGAIDPAFTYTPSDLGASFTGALDRAAGENVGSYAIGQGTLSAGTNYDITFVSNNFTITAKPITVTADAGQTKVYGAIDPAFTYTSSDLGASFTGALERAAGEDVGTYAINQGTLSAGSNYTISFTGNDLTITQATLTATANDKTITVGDPDPLFDITYTGFQFTDTAAVLDNAPTCGVSVTHTDVGTYPITCSGGLDNNYLVSHVDGTLTVAPVPVAIFADVPLTYWANSFIERLYHAGITGGCTSSPLNYCPTNSVTRAQMAIFLVRGLHGPAFVPPTATGLFADVPVGSFGASYIEQLFADGITSGCGGGNYCPNANVTRAQMAIFLVRARHGVAFVPPTATGVFSDVPVGSFGADFIEQLAADAITSGCGPGIYCPGTAVKRDQMAVFLVRTFNLP